MQSRTIKMLAWVAYPILASLLFVTPAFGTGVEKEPRLALELEAGPLWQSRNDVQIPNTQEGTRFSLVDAIGQGPWPAARFYATWNITSRHSLRALAAPLSITETADLDTPIRFEGESFDPGVRAEATYKFNSYRLTYRYKFHEGSRFDWRVGFTAKIRDAKVELRQSGKTARKTDVGFVPLLHVQGLYRLSDGWRLVLDVDALAGGPGRAEDASLKLCADLNERWSVALGYRTIEGGADVDEVYSFAWLHYAVVSSTFRF